MKRPPFSAARGLTHGLAVLGLLASSLQAAPDLILDEVSVAHLNLEFAEAEESTFEETVFALGVIEVLPGKRAVVSSRIPGRVIENRLQIGAYVTKGEKLVLLENIPNLKPMNDYLKNKR